jgi:hypothetical protein
MSTIQINTSDTINQINKKNDIKQNLGDGDKMFHRQEKNGIDLLCPSEFSDSLSFDTQSCNKLNSPIYPDEMTKYENANMEYNTIMKKNNEQVQNGSNTLDFLTDKKLENFSNVPQLNYEDMYKDKICTFFIGSVTVIGLFIVYKMIER